MVLPARDKISGQAHDLYEVLHVLGERIEKSGSSFVQGMCLRIERDHNVKSIVFVHRRSRMSVKSLI